MELRVTETNAADDSAGRAFGLDGNLYLPVVVAAVGSLGGVIALTVLGHVAWLPAGMISAVPLGLTLGWAFGLRQGRPRGYDRDRVEAFFGETDLTRTVTGAVWHGRTHAKAPDARFLNGMLVFGTPERGGVVAKGFLVEAQDLRGASHPRLNAHQDQMRAILALVGEGCRVQFQWKCEPDYRPDLAGFRKRTSDSAPALVQAARNERVSRYWPRMQQGTLRRERLAIFFSLEVITHSGVARTREGLREHYAALLGALATKFEEIGRALRATLGNEARVFPMDDSAHCAFIQKFLNPTLAERDRNVVGFDPQRTLQENCFLSEGVGRADGGFYLDGHYHAVLTMDRWPQRTSPGIVTHLTGLPFLDYAITVIVVPGRVGGEIHREEQAVERLSGEYSSDRRHSLLVALRKKERKIENLAGGFVRPFAVTYVIRIWARSQEVLRDRVRAVQQAIHGMDGAQYLEASLPSTARKLFFATYPGWTHSSYVHRQLYAEDNYLADLLPFSGTFTGALESAEALYDGTNLNLVGVSSQAGGSPQHALVVGMSGSGKSEWSDDLFLQTAGEFAHTLIIDFGGSHKELTEKLGGTPIVVHPDANLTLNYLDTQGLPLTQLHLATVVALLARMVGLPETAEQLALRQAQLSQYVHQLYRDTFVDWSRRHQGKAEEVRRLACAVHRWRELMPAGTTALEAFADLRDRRVEGNAEALAFVAGLTEAEINRFVQEPATASTVAQTACAFYTPADYPTHAALVELLAYARLPEHGQEEIERLATLLRAWNSDGPYGRLFDGTTTVSLQRSIAHFELGLIPEQAVELKAAAGLLISGVSRQHIISLPRALRKRALFEEVSQFLDVPGGEQILAESYAQLRKFNCWAVSVVQQYARFRASPIRAAVIGNAKQFFLMRQSDKNDMADLAKDVGLPESAVEAIQQYPLPEQQPEEARYSSVCYFAPTAQPPQCGTLRHFQAKEAGDAS
ncbi:MAG TPA: hypothetical protein VL200_00975 [Lacunisphaera sp.]|jgi:hypothetical protein|nr:hypothetical protein [Lacunisphaera sp.]